MSAMKMKTMIALVMFGAFACLASANPSTSLCSSDCPCWRPPAAVLPESEGTTEREAVAALFCSLICAESTAERDVCQRGCLIRNNNTSLSLQNCTEICGNSSSCEDGCDITLQSPDMYMHASPPPDSPPDVNVAIQEGIYDVSLPIAGSGSGELDNDVDQQDEEAYLIQVQDSFGNESYFTATLPSRSISLLEFACSEVNISFAIVTTESVSEYSQSSRICVFLPPGGPNAPGSLSEEFEEDLREGYLQHAILTLHWERPSNFLRLENYQLIIEHTPPPPEEDDGNCEGQDTLNIILERELTHYTIMAANTSLQTLPLYPCYYRVRLVSLPGKKNVSVNIEIRYRRNEREDIDTNCVSIFDPEQELYSISVAWRIANPLVVEAIRRFEIGFEIFKNLIISFPKDILEPEDNQMEFKHILSNSIFPSEERRDYIIIVTVRRNSSFFWRRPIIQRMYQCSVTIPPHLPPAPVLRTTIRVEGINSKSEAGKLTFSVSWEPPSIINGVLVLYELCLGQEATRVQEENCTLPSMRLCVIASEGATTDEDCTPLELGPSGLPALNIEYTIDPDSSGVYLQIRTQNSLGLFSNWSDSLFVNVTMMPSPSGRNTWIFAVIAVAVLLVILALLFVGTCSVYKRYCFHRRIKLGETVVLRNPSLGHTTDLDPLNAPLLDQWELRREDVEVLVDKPLGKGEFGKVYKALLQPKIMHKLSGYSDQTTSEQNCVVAIKMLKDNCVSSEKADFLKEIEMIKNVSGTDNNLKKFVVNMVGCITAQEPMMLVLEFVEHGNLLSYLRGFKNKATAESSLVQSEGLSVVTAGNSRLVNDDDNMWVLNEWSLVDFARQIAAGMEYLSSLGIVHRDLACRNILVGEGKVLKISDFGMSRLLPSDAVYVQTTHGRLPIRWMAIEALLYRQFSTKTDVWSYGVVLWEICTMGHHPYPALSNRELLRMLRSGYRMERTDGCSEQVYKVMRDCWKKVPDERPTFSELHNTFDSFLEQQTQDQFPYMVVLSSPYSLEEPEVDEVPIDLDMETSDTTTNGGNTGHLGTSTERPSQEGERRIEEDGQEMVPIRYVELPT